MERSLSNTVLDSISRFALLSSHPAVKAEPVRKFYQNVDDVSKLLMPLIVDIVDSEGVSGGQLCQPLEEVDAIVDEAINHVEAWHQLSSKVCFVSQTVHFLHYFVIKW